MVFKTDYHLMQVESIAECSKGSILQYFRPSLSYHLSLRLLFCLFLSGCFTQVLLYLCHKPMNMCLEKGTFSRDFYQTTKASSTMRALQGSSVINTLLNDSECSLNKKWLRPVTNKSNSPIGWKSKRNTFLPSV